MDILPSEYIRVGYFLKKIWNVFFVKPIQNVMNYANIWGPEILGTWHTDVNIAARQRQGSGSQVSAHYTTCDQVTRGLMNGENI